MVAILGGLGAAVAFAVTTLTASRATRMIGAPSVLAWVLFTGFCIVVPWAALEGRPEGLDEDSVAFLVLSGAGNVVGLLLAYSALRVGKVGIVAPIISTEGAIAAVIAVLAGEHIAEGSGIVLAAIAVGIVLAAVAGNSEDDVAHAVDDMARARLRVRRGVRLRREHLLDGSGERRAPDCVGRIASSAAGSARRRAATRTQLATLA